MLYQGFIGGYDVAIVLTGDLDFAPAMRRVRDQGKLVALLSIPRYCSVLLTSAPTSTDYTVLLTPLLDDLIIENDSQKVQETYELLRSIIHCPLVSRRKTYEPSEPQALCKTYHSRGAMIRLPIG